MIEDTTTDHPLVTFALFAYNQEKYIREAVEGAFSQTYEPLEIILSDDCSGDRTFEIMQEMAAAYAGSHEVKVRRNEVNLGLAGHVNLALTLCKGDLLLLAAGDDVSLPQRSQLAAEVLSRHPNASAAMFSADVIDESGAHIGQRFSHSKISTEVNQSLNDLMTWRHKTFGATRVIRMDVLRKFEALSKNCPTEDTPFLLRSLMCGYNVLSREKVVRYRRHGQNLSGLDSISKMDTAAIYRQYEIDIETAKKSGFLSDLQASNLMNWAKRDEVVRSITHKVNLRVMLTPKEWRFVLPNLAWSAKEKLNMIYVLLFKVKPKSR